jgi:gamma-glutamyltranspeptidase / glutathione hydrolase
MSAKFSVLAKNGMVASSQPLATLAGVRVLMEGGNAIDAAVATAAVLGVVEPMSIGIGGDAFTLLYSAKEKRIKALDASGRSPYAASLDFCRANQFNQMPQRGIHSVTVPGAVQGWATLLRSYGTRKLGELLQPAIRHAEEGFPVAELTAESWHESESTLNDDEGAAINYLVNGRAPKAGEVFRNSRMANTLRRIADEGPDLFYKGDIAEKIVRCSERKGGLFTLKDFADHSSDWVEPITAGYRGYDVFELPPATHGFVALAMLEILEGFDLTAMGQASADVLHLMIEAKKLAFFDRDTYLADRDFMQVRAMELFSERRANALRARIHMDRATDEIETVPLDASASVSPPARAGMKAAARNADTEYLAAADSEGNLVSFIQSNFMGFGSGVVEPETGIILQNRGHLFSLDETHPNCIGPHKRCVHTLMPGMVFQNGKPYAALGLKGGHVQPQVQVQIISRLIDFAMTVQEAISSPRFNHLNGVEVALEPGIAPTASQALTRRGHKVVAGAAESFGGAHAIVIDPESGIFMAGSDPRKGGCALGF